jgi:hypothetical protein
MDPLRKVCSKSLLEFSQFIAEENQKLEQELKKENNGSKFKTKSKIDYF